MNRRRDLAAAVDDLRQRAGGGRFLLGICGAPGAGKSTIAQRVADELGPDSVVVPMDGFHLASSVIRDTLLATRRGAPDTFDGAGFVALLRRLRNQQDAVVYAPKYERTIEDPIAGAILVKIDASIVIVEGNYLLHTEPPWSTVSELLDETWYVEHADDRTRVERLIDRHVQFGKSLDESTRWVHESDERNARLIAAGRSRADLIVTEHRDGQVHISRP
jgi:pantothenate kinase